MTSEQANLQAQLADLQHENQRLRRINGALIERVEAGSSVNASPYAVFEHSTALAEQVRERTAELSELARRLRMAKQEAEQANHSKTKFLAAVSHDVLQPLNAARLFVGALMEQSVSLEAADLIQSVNQSLDNIDRLLSTLIDISRLDAGVIQPDVSEFFLHDLLRQLAAEYHQIAGTKKISFRAHGAGMMVSTDAILLGRVLRNFLSNAMRYTPPGGRVVFGCRIHAETVDIEVWDTGPGIAEHQLSDIFVEFHRLPTSSYQVDRGLGLGLAIVDKIARLMDHPIAVKSELGKGSCFSIQVPRACKAPMCEPTSARRVSTTYPEPLLGKRIWLIENDLQVVAAMRALLTRWGCSVVSAPDFPALSAQVHVATDPVDILLSDYHLDHQLRGLTVIQDIYAARGDATPAVIITADHSLDLKEQVRISGYELLHKPIKPHRLRALLTSLLTSAGGMG